MLRRQRKKKLKTSLKPSETVPLVVQEDAVCVLDVFLWFFFRRLSFVLGAKGSQLLLCICSKLFCLATARRGETLPAWI